MFTLISFLLQLSSPLPPTHSRTFPKLTFSSSTFLSLTHHSLISNLPSPLGFILIPYPLPLSSLLPPSLLPHTLLLTSWFLMCATEKRLSEEYTCEPAVNRWSSSLFSHVTWGAKTRFRVSWVMGFEFRFLLACFVFLVCWWYCLLLFEFPYCCDNYLLVCLVLICCAFRLFICFALFF